tara:strand:- start:24 stop:1661 length:1638 start_codon:yes stop_codon:yes gene_type:complete
MATATTKTAPSGIFSNIDLKDLDLNNLAKFLAKVGRRVPLLSNLVTTQMGDATLPANAQLMKSNIPGVVSGEDLSSDSAEVARKKAERQAALDEARRNRTSATVADKVRDAAERGEYGFNPTVVSDETVNKPKVEIFPELTEAEKLPATTAGGVINVNDLISRPIGGGFIPEETFTDLTYTPIPEIEDFTILTMANKNKDTVKIGNKVYPKDQTELKYRPDKIIDGVKVKGKGYRVVKEEFKDEGEKKRIADGQTIRKELPQFLEDNPAIKERLYTSSISGKPDLEKIQEYFKEEFNIDFKTKTYEKIISQEIGNRKKEGRTYGKATTAINDFKKGLRQYAKDRYGENLSNEEVDRYVQDFRAGLQAEFPDQGTGEFYTDDQVRIVGNLIADTIFAGRYKDPSDIGFDQYLDSYVFDKKERTKEKLKKIEEGETDKRKFVMEIGHQGEMGSGDILFGEAADPARYSAQTREDNAFQQAGQLKHKKARAEGDVETMKKIEEQFKNRNIRAMYLDEDGFEVYIGADAPKGKLKDGGLVGISHLIRPL